MTTFAEMVPYGSSIEIFGLEASNNGRSCEYHEVCGSVVELDMVLCLKMVKILNGKFVLFCLVAGFC